MQDSLRASIRKQWLLFDSKAFGRPIHLPTMLVVCFPDSCDCRQQVAALEADKAQLAASLSAARTSEQSYKQQAKEALAR
jgi:hypothetical protein